MRYLLGLGFDIIVVAPEDDSSQYIVDMGCNFIHVPIDPKSVNPLADTALFFKLHSLYRRIKPSLIFHFTIKPNIYGSIAAGLLGIPSVAVVTGLGYTFINDNIISRIARILYRLGLLFANEVWFLNNDDMEHFLANTMVDNVRVFVLPGEGIDTDFYAYVKPSQKNTFTFLFIGRLLRDKGIGEYVKVAKIASEKQMNWRFLIAGDYGVKNPAAIKKTELDQWVSNGYVEYLGVATDVRQFISDADCIVLPSYREGLPRVLLEAASSGRAIIATDVPGCKDVVYHEINGYLCKIKDENDLLLQMHRISSCEYGERVRLGLSGRDIVSSKYSVEIVNNIYLEHIEKLLGEKQ